MAQVISSARVKPGWFSWKPPVYWSRASEDQQRETLLWLISAVVGGSAPFWGPTLALAFTNTPRPLSDYFVNGDVLVFSGGLLAAAIPVAQRRRKEAELEYPLWLAPIALLTFVIIALLINAVAFGRAVSVIHINERGIAIASAVLFGAIIYMAFITELISSVRSGRPPTTLSKSEAVRTDALDRKVDLVLAAEKAAGHDPSDSSETAEQLSPEYRREFEDELTQPPRTDEAPPIPESDTIEVLKDLSRKVDRDV